MKSSSKISCKSPAVKKKLAKSSLASRREIQEARVVKQKSSSAAPRRQKAPLPPGFKSVTQVSLGFERGHPLVWDYFRTKGILVIGYNAFSSKNRMNFLVEGTRVFTCIPKSQGGSGIVGIGKVTGPAKIFLKGGHPIRDNVGTEYRAFMRKIYSDSRNRPSKSRQCFNKQFKWQQAKVKECKDHAEMTSWDFSQREGWSSVKVWAKRKHDPNCLFAYVPVQWDRTTDFENGISKIDWHSLGLPNFTLSSMSCVMPRKMMHAHWAAIRTYLGKASRDTSTVTSGKGETQVPPSELAQAQKVMPATKSNSLDTLLASNGLSKYGPDLYAEEVNDVATLKLLNDSDLKAIGLPLGPRRKLQAVLKTKR